MVDPKALVPYDYAGYGARLTHRTPKLHLPVAHEQNTAVRASKP